MPSRDHILHKVRLALGRNAGQPPSEAPPPRLRLPELDQEHRIRQLLERFPGRALRAALPAEAREYIAALIAGRSAVASDSPLLEQLGILSLPEIGVACGDPASIREACARADIGITTAEYALADTGALVVLASGRQPRLLSLLPLVHITVLPGACILTGLDELLTLLPDPAALSSSMVLIGGPSRTADIEQILTLGVHGPRELHLVVV